MPVVAISFDHDKPEFALALRLPICPKITARTAGTSATTKGIKMINEKLSIPKYNPKKEDPMKEKTGNTMLRIASETLATAIGFPLFVAVEPLYTVEVVEVPPVPG